MNDGGDQVLISHIPLAFRSTGLHIIVSLDQGCYFLPRIHSTSKKGQLKGHCLLQATLGESYQKVFSGLDTLEGLMDSRFIGCIMCVSDFLLRPFHSNLRSEDDYLGI